MLGRSIIVEMDERRRARPSSGSAARTMPGSHELRRRWPVGQRQRREAARCQAPDANRRSIIGSQTIGLSSLRSRTWLVATGGTKARNAASKLSKAHRIPARWAFACSPTSAHLRRGWLRQHPLGGIGRRLKEPQSNLGLLGATVRAHAKWAGYLGLERRTARSSGRGRRARVRHPLRIATKYTRLHGGQHAPRLQADPVRGCMGPIFAARNSLSSSEGVIGCDGC